MVELCVAIAAAATTVVLPTSTVTLAWVHSVEKTAWQEDYVVAGNALLLARARVKRSGAGMEPPEAAVWRDGWWEFQPALPPMPEVVFANSSFVAGYMVCWQAECRSLTGMVGRQTATLRVLPCVERS